MLVEELSPPASREWDCYVDAHPDANLYHLRVWKEVAEDAYRLRAPFLLARDAATRAVRGVLPLFCVRAPLNRYVTTGLFGACGRILADQPRIRAALLCGALRIASEEGARYLLVKGQGADELGQEYQRLDHCVTSSLPLAAPAVMWAGFRKELRRAVRKAERSGFVVRVGHDQLPAYYEVLAAAMHIKGTPIYGYRFMEVLAERLGHRCEVMTLSLGGVPVSAALFVFYRSTAYLPFSASLPSSFPMRPNNLLFWEIMKRSFSRGMRRLDLGRSPRGSTGLDFKLRWGCSPEPQPWFVQPLRGAPPRFDLQAPALRRLIRLWQALPRWIADALGPSVCRRFIA